MRKQVTMAAPVCGPGSLFPSTFFVVIKKFLEEKSQLLLTNAVNG